MSKDVTKPILLSVVIPTYGVEEALADTVREAAKAAETAVGEQFEVVIPYTPRRGETEDTIRNLRTLPDRTIIVVEPRRGYGRAYIAGFKRCRGRLIVTLDADLTYPLDILPRAVTVFEALNLDFLNTDRLQVHEDCAFTWSHNLGNRVLSRVMNLLFNTGFNDSQSGMWLIRRDSIDKMKFEGIHWEFSAEIKIEARIRRLRCAETPIRYRARMAGSTTNSWREGLKIALFMLAKRLGAVRLFHSIIRPPV
ncbi:MAG: glycosyltransferase family 2 protein [Candidatus Thorarchaeota archaeon]|nr:glycosyltransferase family 2 protein [Candidatus Thorarchaeota archaeon]